MSEQFVCPECGSDLNITATNDWGVNSETGECECPTIDNYFHCDGCEWDSHSPDANEIRSKIIDINLVNGTLGNPTHQDKIDKITENLTTLCKHLKDGDSWILDDTFSFINAIDLTTKWALMVELGYNFPAATEDWKSLSDAIDATADEHPDE